MASAELSPATTTGAAADCRSDLAAGALASGEPDSLAEVAGRALEEIRSQIASGGSFDALDALDDCVTIKNSQGVIVYDNAAHRRWFSPDASPVGRTAHAYLDPAMAFRTDKVAELVLGGCPFVECEHSGRGPDGSTYRVQVHKRSLQALGAPGLAVLGVIRVLSRDETKETARACELSASCERFRELAKRDQEICRLTALGVSSRELGERLGMTTRGIELRKQKAFAHLGVAKAVDLARLLTRLQDRGHLDLGL